MPRLLTAVALGLGLALPPATAGAGDGLAGAYLAGRQAASDFDYVAAASYYTRALQSDPGNPAFLEQLIVARLALGDLDRALPLADRIEQAGARSQAANMAVLADLARNEKYGEIIAELDAGRSLGPLVDSLLRAWAQLGAGQMSDASKTFDGLIADEGTRAFGLYHKALAVASVGDFEGADRILSGEAEGPLRATRRGVLAHAEVLSQLERDRDAADLLAKAFGDAPDPAVARVASDLAAGAPVPFDIVTGARDGLAEVFFTVAGALGTEEPDPYALAYARLAAAIRPGFSDAILMAAGILEAQSQFDLANAAYNTIPSEDPNSFSAEIGRANVLVRAGRPDAAIEVLRQLAKARPDIAVVWSNLGDLLRRQGRHQEAVAAYDRAIGLFSSEQPGQWGIYFARGIAHEQMDDLTAADADFLMALKLNPDQPQVLNYLGYSYVERRINLEQALDMIRRAVRAEPDSGAIVDSLGWALYRLGRYDEAVVEMEKAISLMPSDPVLNDHLGDVYWAVGRRREAEFQWRRALSFEPNEDTETERIRRKLEIGLDAVLKEEGSAPLSVSKNGN
ncbi:MAG: tetratricopeptide repeat protein [Rhodobacteraceae bacterium]|nr:tetratricopeptide repeat protein [Paracoccaceae bacterium]